MVNRLLSISPLVFFAALVLLTGYFVFGGVQPIPVTPTPTKTLTPTEIPPPTPTNSATPRRIPSPTPTSTPVPTKTPTQAPQPASTDTPTPSPTPSPNPITLVWVQTGDNLSGPPHTLGVRSPVAENPVLQPYGAAPALSPDGTKMAFFAESSLSGFNTGIWIAEIADGFAKNHQLLNDVTNVQNIAWSPDGDKIAFEVIVNPEVSPDNWRSQVRVIRADPAGGYIELSDFDGRQPAWSPGSQSLVAQTCKGSSCGLFVINCTGGNCDYENASQITFDITDSYPSWSVDNLVAFTTKRDGNHEIYILDLADNDLRNLTNRPGTDITPIFSPDGRQVFFRTDFPEGMGWEIQVMTLDDSRRIVQGINTVFESVGGDDRNWGLVRPTVR